MVHTPLEDSLDQLLILSMIYTYIILIIGRNAFIEVIYEIFERGVFEVIKAKDI